MTDLGNPYRAPEAPIAVLRGEVRRPPVYTAIAAFCLLLCIPCVLLGAGSVYFLGVGCMLRGWREALFTNYGPQVMITGALSFLAAITHAAAARLLWVRRGSLGLSLCVAAIALTYLTICAFLWN